MERYMVSAGLYDGMVDLGLVRFIATFIDFGNVPLPTFRECSNWRILQA